MALQTFPNFQGPLLSPFAPWQLLGTTNRTMDNSGESIALVGHVFLSTGPGTSKTISSAGGKLFWRPGAVTFAAAAGATQIRCGIQDVGVTGLEDGTHDVYGDLVSATDTITANVVNTVVMGTGTKTIAHGDLIAVVFEMTARGSPDSVVVPSYSMVSTTPHITVDSGSGPALVGAILLFTIQFDDGTVGWFGHDAYAAFYEGSTAFSSSSSPDEYALAFQIPFRASAVGIYAQLASLASTDDFEMILYSDPFGTPVAERTLVHDMSLSPASSFYFERPFLSAYTLEPNTNYAIALRPTTTNTLSYNRYSFGSGNGILRTPTVLGTNWSQYTRSNQSGAFGSEDTTLLPIFGVRLGMLSDDASAGGGGSRGFGMTGGMA